MGAVVLAGGPWLFFRAEGTPPAIEAPGAIVTGAAGGSWTVRVADADAGLKGIRVSVDHAGGEITIAEDTLPGSVWMGGDTPGREIPVELTAAQVASIEGDARLVVAATDWSLCANLAQREVAIEIDLSPPRVEVNSGLTYVKHGGSGAVAYRVSEDSARDGVEVEGRFFQGHPRPGAGPRERMAIFAIPADAPKDPSIEVVAYDAVGNRASSDWAVVAQYKGLPTSRIELDDRFMKRILPRFGRTWSEDGEATAAAFDSINRELRALLDPVSFLHVDA